MQNKLENRLADLKRQFTRLARPTNLPNDGGRSDQNRSVAESCRPDIDPVASRLQELECACRAAEARTQRITAEKYELSKEIGRLRHIEQLRTVPTQYEAMIDFTET